MRICDKELVPAEIKSAFKTRIQSKLVIRAMRRKENYWAQSESVRTAEIERQWTDEHEVGWKDGEYVLFYIEGTLKAITENGEE